MTTPDQDEDQVKVKAETIHNLKITTVLAGACIAFLSISGAACFTGVVNLAGNSTTLPTFGDRAQFTFKYQTLPLTWLLLLIFNVILRRVFHGALNPLEGRDCYFTKQKNILQNSLEQFILSAWAQLVLISFIDEETTLWVIPWVNMTFFVGRVTYCLGYPTYRGFGMFACLLPTTRMVGFCVVKFVMMQISSLVKN